MKKKRPAADESTNYVNLERLTSLVDGVFAITTTLLVLELRPPESSAQNLKAAHQVTSRGLGPGCHVDLEKDWKTPAGRALVEKWVRRIRFVYRTF